MRSENPINSWSFGDLRGPYIFNGYQRLLNYGSAHNVTPSQSCVVA